MKKTKKAIMIILAVVMIISLVTACSKQAAPTQETPKEKFPTKPINMIIPWSAGGGSDVGARILVPYLEKELGTTINVINKTGANGWVAWTEVAKSTPDGYTIAMINLPAFYSGYLDTRQNRKENLESFKLIANHVSDWGVLVVKKGDNRFPDAKGFIEYAKKNELTVGDAGIGSNMHMATENLKTLYKDAKFTPVHMNGWNDTYTALLGGHIDATVGTVGQVLGPLKNGEIEVLCSFSPERSKFLKDIPTFKELGLGEMLSYSDRGFMMPANPDPEVYKVLSDAFNKAINNPEHIAKLAEMGLDVNYVGGDEYAKWAKKNEQEAAALAPIMGWK